MGTSILEKASGFLRKKGKYAAVLAGVLAVTTAGYRMALPGFTLERELVCGLEEHVHTEACFPPLEPETGGETDGIGGGGNPGMDSQPGEGGPTGGGTTEKVLACPFEGKEAHAHTADCYETGKKLTCGQEEGAGAHTHVDECYTTAKELACGREESAGHTHDAACYQTEAELTCGQGESAGHSHGDGCYDENGTAICGQEEGAGGHTHSDTCYSSVDRLTCTQAESEGHTHGDGCYTETRGLACGQEESAGHTHGEGCYEEESRLVCGKEEYNPADHVHGDGCYIEAPATGTEGNGGAGGAAPGGNGEGTGNGTAGGDTQGGGNGIAGDGTAGSSAGNGAAGSDTESGTDKERQPICGLEEHTHTDACYGAEIMAVAGNVEVFGDGWQLDDEGLLTITAIDEATAEMPDYESGRAPWYIHRGKIKSVKLEGITRIGAYAFDGCSQLTKVEIPEGVTEIGWRAFNNCGMLGGIEIPESVTTIGGAAFSSCKSLKEVRIPSSVTVIDERTFYNCNGLKNISLPENLERIGQEAFYSCSALEQIHIPAKVMAIGESAFYNCKLLTKIDIVNNNIARIENQTFEKCKSLISMELPVSITEIGDRAFSECEKLYRISLPEGLTSIGRWAFSGCSRLSEIKLPESVVSIGEYGFSGCPISEIELGEAVKEIGAGAFDSLTSLILKTENLNALNNSVKLPENLKRVEIYCGTVDVLGEGLLAWWNSADVSFRESGHLSIQGSLSLGRPVRNELKAGEYYADGKGALYLLQEGGASLAYVPAGVSEYRVMGSIPSPDGGEGWPVVSVERDALKMADGLERLIFEGSAEIVSLPDYSCGNCPSLVSVNGESTVEGVHGTFTNKNIRIGIRAFYNTGLQGETLGLDKGTIVFKKDDNPTPILSMSTEKKGILPGEDWKWELYTAEQADTIIGLSRPENVNLEYSVARCYFEFENGDGNTVYGDEDANSNYEFEVVDKETGISYTIKARKAENPYTYYYEIPMPEEGGTLSLRLHSWYPSPTSGGGKVKIWPVLLTEEERVALGDGVAEDEMGFHQVSWVTKANEFEVKKGGNKLLYLQGNGTDGGNIYLKRLSYDISMKRKAEELEGIGKDYMISADFTDMLKLPEGLRWREDVLEAVEAGRYFSDGSSDLYVNVGDTQLLLCKFGTSGEYLYPTNIKAAVEAGEDGKKELQIKWEARSKNTAKEMGYCKWTIYFGDEVILVEIPEDGEGVPAEYAFTNEVKVVQHFNYSGSNEDGAVAESKVAVSEGNCTVTKTTDYASTIPNITWGNGFNYIISLQNTGVFPYRNLTSIKDELSSYLYIRPADMAKMIYETEKMSGVGRLEIVIDNASLCEKPEGDSFGPGQSVTGTDGNTYTLTWQDTGVGTEYEIFDPGNEAAGRDPVNPTKAKLTIIWDEEKGIHMEVSPKEGGNTGRKDINSAEEIGSALEEMGYLVTSDAIYTVTWGLGKYDDVLGTYVAGNYLLYSGTKKDFCIPVTVKDTFMQLDQDVREMSKEKVQMESNTAIVSTEGETRPRTGKYTTNYLRDMAYRDYILLKGVRKNGQEMDEEEDSVIPKEVLTYTLEIDHKANPLRGIVPLVDRMRGAQALLVPAEDNGGLEGFDLEKIESGGKMYYLLSKERTYYGVTLGENLSGGWGKSLTHSITVKQMDNGELDTLIRWYLADIQDEGWEKINYNAYILPSVGNGNGFFSLSNDSWLNDHQSHRLYDNVGLTGTNAVIEKMIVTSRGEGGDTEKDNLEEYSQVHEGDATTYRLEIENIGEGRTIEGRQLRDILPEGYRWQKEDVKIEYHPAKDDAYVLEGGEDWSITDTADGRRQIVWGENFKLELKRNIYIYVTLKWPEGDAWGQYVKSHGTESLENEFRCYELSDKVSHDLVDVTKVYLQKGVVSSSAGQGLAKDDENRFYYANGKEVEYYTILYNGGHTNLYLNELQDRLPRGFRISINSLKVTNWNSIVIMDADGHTVTPSVWVSGRASDRIVNGITKISLEGGSSTNSLRYDEKYQMSYLAPGEAIGLEYSCNADASYSQTDDTATNCIAMPFADKGGGVQVMDLKAKGPNGTNKNALKNDGNCDLLTAQQAEELGFTGGEDDTQWLASSVDVKRGEIIPGITKKVAGLIPNSGIFKEYEGAADASDTIRWEVTATNGGREPIIDYTLTDAVESPYSYKGMVSLEIEAAGKGITNDLFNIKESTRKGEEEELCLTLEKLPSTSYGKTWTWKKGGVNGTKIDTNTYELKKGDIVWISLQTKTNSKTWGFEVSLSGSSGHEALLIHCIRPEMSIPSGGSATLTLHTKNIGSQHQNKTYFNRCYITPQVQQYNGNLVSEGNHLDRDEYNGKPSVRNSARVDVSFGYTTTSEKAVEEAVDSQNRASSNSDPNYILLPGADSLFRYTLTVNNPVSNSWGMKRLVLIDSLPEVGDHNPFTEDEPRFSEFQVDLADDPKFEVWVRKSGETGPGEKLPEGSYRLEFSGRTEFTEGDWKGEAVDWNEDMASVENGGGVRSFRIAIVDDGTDGAGDLIPAGASVDVKFTGQVAKGEVPMPGEAAWNSFGYQYVLKGEIETSLESTPLNVGVRLPDVPRLVKELVDGDGRPAKAAGDAVFRFLVYQGGRLELDEGFTGGELAEALSQNGREFTCVDVMVKGGSSQSEAVALEGMAKWAWEGADTGAGMWQPTGEPWAWADGEKYTVVELPPAEDGDCRLASLGGIRGNGYTFTHSDAQGRKIIAVNTMGAQEAYELPETGGTGARGHMLAGAACLMVAGALLYRKRRGLRASR